MTAKLSTRVSCRHAELKRPLPYIEIEFISGADHPTANSNMNGAVTGILPVKKGQRSLFLTALWLMLHLRSESSVLYNASKQKELQEFHPKNAIQLINCEIKSCRYRDGFEVLLKSSSRIEESHCKKGLL